MRSKAFANPFFCSGTLPLRINSEARPVWLLLAFGPRGVVLQCPPRFNAVQITTLLHVPRMRGNSHVGHTEEMPGSDFSDFQTIEVLLGDFRDDPPHCALYLGGADGAEELSP